MDFYPFLPLLIVILFLTLILPFLRYESKNVRVFVLCAIAAFGFYYFYWRFSVTLPPISFLTLRDSWMWFCFLFEAIIFIEILTYGILMLKPTNYSKQADNYEKILRALPKDHLPTIDVMITTLGEGEDILERSILGCLHLDWPKDKLNVWILDDGDRDWLRDFCSEKGVLYVRREDKKHGKAGNINHALHLTNSEFFISFDADFIPFRNFIYRTLGFFTDPKVAIVQTPQNFFNKDPIQTNLHIQDYIVDEQRLFFNKIMPARDGWGVAFWCGSSSIARTKVIKKYGGLSSDTITEDFLTSIHLLQHGFIVRYLNETLSHGMSAESIDGFAKQRRRWCRGNIQALYTKYGLFRKGLSFKDNALFFPFYWLFNPMARLIAILMPIVYFLTGTPAFLVEHYLQLVHYQLPFVALTFIVSFWYAPRHYVPVISTAGFTLQALEIFPTTIKAIINPFGDNVFVVTPKGKTAKREKVRRFTLIMGLSLFFLTFAGILSNVVPGIKGVVDQGFFPLAAFWGINNLLILGFVILLSLEHPRWRAEERFKVNAEVEAQFEKSDLYTKVHCDDISVDGCSVFVKQPMHLELGQPIKIRLEDVGEIAAEIHNIRDHRLNIKFVHTDREVRHRLIQHIYTGRYSTAIKEVRHEYLWIGILKRIFGKHTEHERYWQEFDKKSGV